MNRFEFHAEGMTDMVQRVGRLADRLLSLVAPNTAAAACQCDFWECSGVCCDYGETGCNYTWTNYYNCDCVITRRSCTCPYWS